MAGEGRVGPEPLRAPQAPHDPLTLAVVVGVVAAAGTAACLFPARRATRVDPMSALRYE